MSWHLSEMRRLIGLDIGLIDPGYVCLGDELCLRLVFV